MEKSVHEKLLRELESSDWQYAPHDPDALDILKDRIADTGKKGKLISYSDLVRGVDFHYRNINEGRAFRITFFDHEWLDCIEESLEIVLAIFPWKVIRKQDLWPAL